MFSCMCYFYRTAGNKTAQREKPRPLTHTSPWNSLNIIMEDDSMSEISEVLEQSNQLSQDKSMELLCYS